MRKTTVVSGMLLSLALAGAAWSVSAAFFEVRTAEELGKGKLEDVVAAEPGRLTLGPEKKELLKADGEIVWSVAVDRAGAIYAGTSHKGNVYVSRAGKSEVTAKLDDPAIFAVTVGNDGRLYVGGSPSGTVYKDGKTFCKTGQSYIWSLLFDGKGSLYAATGPDGKVLRIDAAGNATTVLDSSDPHVMSLARDSKGNIYAGTSKSGLVYRIDAAGNSRVIYDASEGEIRALAVDEKDNLYFGTADVKQDRPALPGPMGIRSARTMPTEGEGGDGSRKPPSGPPGPPTPAPAPIRDEVTATNAVYRMSVDGSVIRLYEVRGKMILSLLARGTEIYVGTGNRGDLIRIDENLDVTMLEKDLEKQVLSLTIDPNGELLMGTGDGGRVMRYGAEFVKEGFYTSTVFDAKFAARFGTVTWTGGVAPGTSIEVTTQTGNVAEPDASWSDWSKPYGRSGETITSPGARFIRYRMKLKTALPKATPEIDEVRLAYLTSNQPPRVKAVQVKTPAEKNKNGKKPDDGGQVEVSWQAEDPNGDKLQYSVEFRMRGDAHWRMLEEKTDKTSYAWKTEAMADGTYEVRVRATDEPDNPKDVALTHLRVSQPFVVDNTRPAVTVMVIPDVAAPGKAAASVTVSDALSVITRAEYAVDSGEWQAFLPDDRIFDSREEKATLELRDLQPGEHTLTVRGSDESGNTGAASKGFTIR